MGHRTQYTCIYSYTFLDEGRVRTGQKDLYIHYLRSKGVQVEVIAADAIGKEKTTAVITLFTRSLQPEISGQFLVLSEFPHFECPMGLVSPPY